MHTLLHPTVTAVRSVRLLSEIRSKVPLRFEATGHVYTTLDGRVLPSITQLLKAGGYVDTTWFTDEGRDRGGVVHEMTAALDQGALDVRTLVHEHKNRVCGYASAMTILRPDWILIEQALASARGFAGRPDRAGYVRDRLAVLDIKTGQPAPSNAIQTALQAILVGEAIGERPEWIDRYCIYLAEDGGYKVDRHVASGDFVKALNLVHQVCG